MRAIETTGTLDIQGHLHLDTPQPQAKPSRVRIILLLSEPDPQYDLSAMASDPDIQAEIAAIHQEFAVAEMDGLITQ
jgi:hypothetical protein